MKIQPLQVFLISDHFITFSTLKSTNRTSKPKTFSYRDFSKNNINYEDFNNFWDSFNAVFELHFPLINKKFYKNIHKTQLLHF